jgi:hypothetical protein
VQPRGSLLALGSMKRVAIGGLIGLAGAMVITIATPAASNVWSLVTARGFFIPAESSVFSFQVTKENAGSGEWWLYAEDQQHLFALHPEESIYLSAPRAAQARCPKFDSLNFETWCSASRHPVPAQ